MKEAIKSQQKQGRALSKNSKLKRMSSKKNWPILSYVEDNSSKMRTNVSISLANFFFHFDI